MNTYIRDGYRRTGRLPFVHDGITWHTYRTGILRYGQYADGRDAVVWQNTHRDTYSAAAEGVMLGDRFRSERTACLAVAKYLRKAKP